MKKNRGFTFIEIIIIIAIIGAITTLVVLAINPTKQLQKARDGKRKSDLAILKQVLEDWYNDKGCYPKPYQIGYGYEVGGTWYDNPDPTGTNNGGIMKNVSISFMCGSEPSSPSLSPYLSPLPCSPNHSKIKYKTTDYVYQVLSGEVGCPQQYKIYTGLENVLDPVISNLGCIAGSCGPEPAYGYNYGVSSPQSTLNQAATLYCCYVNPGVCNVCGQSTMECESSGVCLSTVYTSAQDCCTAHPGGCPR
ncbi:hypothetical protein AUK57_02250 [Candidatus Saccharibacteria bacterium CG2_30_41_52]|nr:MAG: hypothetical protein AUK57_02250 [Candidatus Saccharibacteria bacterium CG2_30_41_52]